MSDYLYIFRGSENPTAPEAMQKQMQKWTSWIKELSAKGQFKAGEPLDKAGKVVRDRGTSVTDGPFVEAKDIVGGYLIVSARDLNEAVELSKGCPIFDTRGFVEVRPILPM
jgi:hypothetical protein